MSSTRKKILEAAYQATNRRNRHNKRDDSFARIAKLWTAYCGHAITEHDVAMMMALLKIARIRSGYGGLDSHIDLAGYAACAAEIAARAAGRVKPVRRTR